MPRCVPEHPQFTTSTEKDVWERLRRSLDPKDLLLSNVRLRSRQKDHELDLLVVMPGYGAVVLEVKGSSVWHDGTHWRQSRHGSEATIHPVDQARDGCYVVRDYVERDPRWREAGGSRIRWSHAVVLPHTVLPDDFATPDAPRWAVIDRTQLDELVPLLRDLLARQETANRAPDEVDADLVAEILRGRGLPQRDVVAIAQERDDVADRLTQEQAVVLGAIQLLPRVEVRGGAGSGKTWLAVEQARRLQKAGRRVALLCYSRGLAAYLTRQVEPLPRKEKPSYVGTYHGLGLAWGAEEGSENDSDYYENRLPAQMLTLARELADGHRFDAVVVDEAQDFADSWWQPLLAALKDEESGGLFVFSDEGQRVFARYGAPPVPLVPLLLDTNMRNTRPIADAFHPLAPMKMRLVGGDGPEVRFVPCASDDAVSAADDEVDALLEAGWRPQDIALLTTGSRHPEQAERQARGQDAYWDSFWDADQVFYGHVLGFKGLERRAVVLAVNETAGRDRSRERLYVGLSRARDQLVVCGDPDVLRDVAPEVARRLGL
ncbi:MAG: NERD domain-containing protein [Actinomycetes bacterium]